MNEPCSLFYVLVFRLQPIAAAIGLAVTLCSISLFSNITARFSHWKKPNVKNKKTRHLKCGSSHSTSSLSFVLQCEINDSASVCVCLCRYNCRAPLCRYLFDFSFFSSPILCCLLPLVSPRFLLPPPCFFSLLFVFWVEMGRHPRWKVGLWWLHLQTNNATSNIL